jgi:general secretion pathway protein B
MSYILEALKKIEQKREQEELPRSVTFSGESSRPKKKQVLWPYLLIAVLLVNAVFLIRWMWVAPPVKTQPPAPPSAAPYPSMEPSPPVSSGERETAKRKARVPVPSIEERGPAPRDRTMTLPRTTPERDVPQTPVVAPKSPDAVAESAAEPEVARPERQSAPAGGRVYTMSELPPDVRSRLPEFKISGHAYSPEPQTRVVRINERILQEGQDLSPGLRLEEIVPAGVILSYHGYRFRIGINQHR